MELYREQQQSAHRSCNETCCTIAQKFCSMALPDPIRRQTGYTVVDDGREHPELQTLGFSIQNPEAYLSQIDTAAECGQQKRLVVLLCTWWHL